MRPCFACLLDDFARETAAQRKPEHERLFKLFCLLLNQYINSFGAALLAAQGIRETVVPDKRRAKTAQPVDKYTAREVAGLLRGFGLFFVMFKVDAPDNVKAHWLGLIRRLVDWMVARGHVSPDLNLSFEPCDDEVKINAVCAAGLINEAAEAQNLDEGQDARRGEPFYLVSRVVPGRLWFLYSPSIGKCAEFGPVAVPPAVANFLKPGWGLDCKFVRIGGRWHIRKVDDVLPL